METEDMKKFWRWCATLLGFSSVPFLLYVYKFHNGLAESHTNWGEFGSLFGGIFSPLTTALGFLGVLYSINVTKKQFLAQTDEKKSLFNFEHCLNAYDEAVKLIEDNNDRVKWVAAGRSLEHAKMLSSLVSEDSHKRALEVKQLIYRRRFYEILHDKPAVFFYGAKDCTVSLNAAAANSSKSPLSDLSEKSIRSVWEAAQFPDDYQETLDKNFSSEDTDKLICIYPELHKFIEHKRRYIALSGRLLDRTTKEYIEL
jgi:hypothetical protein